VTHDPMRQADIERRLSNLAQARRVGSGSRLAARAGALRQSLQLSPPGRAGTLAASVLVSL
jgi:hypothetical protein